METNDRPGSWAFQLALCLLGPIFFLSYLFLILSPLPALYLYTGTADRQKGLLWCVTAIVLGCILCGLIKGWPGALSFFLAVGIPSLVLGELLLRKKGPVKAVLGACLAVILVTFLSGAIAYKGDFKGLYQGSRQYLETQTKLGLDLLQQQSKDNPANAENQEFREELEKLMQNPSSIVRAIPGSLLAALLLLCILPCLAMIRWNPKGFLRRTGIPRDFLRKWKTPEWFVWPTILTIAFLVFEVDYLSIIARNCIIPLLLIYFFQGMSIVAYFLDLLRWRGVIRVLVYMAGVFFSPPSFIMVVSFGFFDFWFNFRERNKNPEQQNEDER